MTTTEVRERPILMIGQMVRATREGIKRCTRRMMPQPDGVRWKSPYADGKFRVSSSPGCRDWWPGIPTSGSRCPYGQPGDRLWVRETWNIARPTEMDGNYVEATETLGGPIPKSRPKGWNVWYAAEEIDATCPMVKPYRPSIHMPRWASRITLEVTDVRVERVQDISEEDAKAEGVTLACERDDVVPQGTVCGVHTYRDAFKALWISINGLDAWDLNPWVWAISFKQVQR